MVSKETMLKRMEKELAEAKLKSYDREAFLRSIEKVKLLCELLLDETEEVKTTESIQISEPIQSNIKQQLYDDDDIKEQPESIFDF